MKRDIGQPTESDIWHTQQSASSISYALDEAAFCGDFPPSGMFSPLSGEKQ
ncbi:MAG TPA: hypothetical protein VHC90_05015 [Bryobacteraceae bacterium]|nr:hypothetical protein [Bryobacteraceae bacterium]